MRRFISLLKYLIPYKWFVTQNIVYNILGAFFALFSFAMVIPFLRVLFNNQPLITETAHFELSTDYFMHMLNYYMSRIMTTHGQSGALLLVSFLVIGFSLLKNGFLFAANNVLAPIRAFVVRDMRNDLPEGAEIAPVILYRGQERGCDCPRIK
jgi:subfamily B ATP-binding cassette protein MsbA